ncbi:MAG: hypothetical protein QOH89_100, partial [Pseudonocardiales bacterium]|nr:hypothetical protein [Pseudonocardiales bacterium]
PAPAAAPGPPAPDEPTVIAQRLPLAESPVLDTDQTRVLPTTARPPGTARPGARGGLLRLPVLIGALAALLVLVFVITYAVSGDSGSPTPVTPRYPSVSGPIGDHLQKLQQDVGP